MLDVLILDAQPLILIGAANDYRLQSNNNDELRIHFVKKIITYLMRK